MKAQVVDIKEARKKKIEGEVDDAMDDWTEDFYNDVDLKERTKAVVEADRKLDKLERK